MFPFLQGRLRTEGDPELLNQLIKFPFLQGRLRTEIPAGTIANVPGFHSFKVGFVRLFPGEIPVCGRTEQISNSETLDITGFRAMADFFVSAINYFFFLVTAPSLPRILI